MSGMGLRRRVSGAHFSVGFADFINGHGKKKWCVTGVGLRVSSMGFASFINRHEIRELVLCVWVRVKNADFSMGFASFVNANGKKELVLCV